MNEDGDWAHRLQEQCPRKSPLWPRPLWGNQASPSPVGGVPAFQRTPRHPQKASKETVRGQGLAEGRGQGTKPPPSAGRNRHRKGHKWTSGDRRAGDRMWTEDRPHGFSWAQDSPFLLGPAGGPTPGDSHLLST
ncbi:hypothetical protein H1C71_011679 [Ictidomys tridecemlineatus]|nr:hypothetical protein H1C71_011679 [Ictidomys tridecemlineatus]